MNNKALFGKLFVLLVAVVAIVLAIIYLTGTFTFHSGKFTFNVDYDKNAKDTGDYAVVEIPDGGEAIIQFSEETPINNSNNITQDNEIQNLTNSNLTELPE